MANRPQLRDHRLIVMAGVMAWEGELSNARVRHLFDVQPVQASRLLAEFRAVHAEAIDDDRSAKVLRWRQPAKVATDMSLDEYARLAGGSETCLVDARVNLTAVSPAVFAAVRRACLEGGGVTICYASMTTPAPTDRLIFPHSLVHVGRRWHVRAWCDKRQGFRDFTLGRITAAELMPGCKGPTSAEDRAWRQQVDLRLVAHRRLSLEQQAVVRKECFGGTMGRRLKVRGCLVSYVIQDVRAALTPERELPPEFQLEVGNPDDLAPWLFHRD